MMAGYVNTPEWFLLISLRACLEQLLLLESFPSMFGGDDS
jgi:hypothetical protein